MSLLKISVLTPTYNRAEKLINLYNSLLNQSYSEFEWIIVNDGSIDNTDDVVKGFINEKNITIKYVKKQNGGKPSAHNAGVQVADSDLTIICDDDDYLTEDCLQILTNYWIKYCDNNIGGMIGYRGENEETTLRNKKFSITKTYSTIKEIFSNEIFDTTQIYKTSILKELLFPITANEKFVPEIWLWKEIDKKYELIVIPEILEICEYQSDGLTMTGSQNIWNNPIGYSYYFFQKAEESNFLDKIKYFAICNGLIKSSKGAVNFNIPLQYRVLGFPISCIVYLKRKIVIK